MVYCHICKIEFEHMNAFLTHHRWHHDGMTTKEYYDIYLKKESEDSCQTPNCKNKCNFYSLTKGYHKHCSRECLMKDQNFQEKAKKAKIKKNGFYNNNRNQAKQTCLERYGKINVSQVEQIKEKKEKTFMKNFGVKCNFATEEHRQYMLDGGAAYCNKFIKNPSKPQIKLYKMVLEVCPYAIMNYPCLNYSIDIAIPFLNLAFEYDGGYWHNENLDKTRDEKLKEIGWETFRFKDRIPSFSEIRRIINKSISTF